MVIMDYLGSLGVLWVHNGLAICTDLIEKLCKDDTLSPSVLVYINYNIVKLIKIAKMER